MQSNHQVAWVDDASSSRGSIPRSSTTPTQIPGCLGIGLGLFVGSWPFLIAAFFHFGMQHVHLENVGKPQPLWVTLAPFLFFGSFSFPIAGFAFYKSLLLLRGKAEIVIDGERLRVITRVGPIWSARRCKLSQLGGFRIEDPKGERFRFQGGCSSLFAVRRNGRGIPLLRSYPDEIVYQLAKDLPRKIEQVTGRVNPGTAGIRAADLDAEIVAIDPMETRERGDKPIGSNLHEEVHQDGVIIHLPRLGFRRSTSGLGKLCMGSFLFVQFILTVGLVPALVAGKVEGEPMAGWVIVGVFTLISISIVVYGIQAAMRSGSVHITSEKLILREDGISGETRRDWKLELIESVEVGIDEDDSGETFTWSHFVDVQPDSGECKMWFDNRSKAEIEWTVTRINHHLAHNTKPDSSESAEAL